MKQPAARHACRLITACALALLTGTAAAGDTTAFDASQPPAAAAAQYIRLKGGDELKGVQKVLLPYFQVEYVTKSWANATAVGKDAQSSTGVSFKLNGIGDAELQALTQRLYERTVADLQAAGISVVPLAEIQGQAAYQGLSEWEKPGPFELDAKGRVAKFFAPAGLKLYFDPGDQRFSLASNFGSMFTTKRHPIQRESDLFKATGIPVMRVRYVVDFTQLETKKSSIWSSGASSSAGGKINLALVPEGTRMVINTTGSERPDVESDARPILRLQQAMISADTSFAKDVREINAASNKAQTVGVGLLSAAAVISGVGGAKVSVASQKDYEVDMDVAAYASAVEQLVAGANAMFLSQVTTAR